MKGLVKYGLAVAMVFATAMPAMARSWVVCVDTTKDARFSTEATAGNNLFFAAAAPIYPGNTVTTTATDCTPSTLKATQVGTFFTIGGGINGLPHTNLICTLVLQASTTESAAHRAEIPATAISFRLARL